MARTASAGWIAGVDEVGRGPLAGPVVAAAVILDPHRAIRGLADSKQLTARRREELAGQVRERALACSIACADVWEIDRLNIFRATLLAMRRAVLGLGLEPEEVWVDGTHTPAGGWHGRAVPQGDRLHPQISAASIVAKVARDHQMRRLASHYPGYGFERHKGYGTAAHLAALRRLGPTMHHRRSFAPVRALLGGPA